MSDLAPTVGWLRPLHGNWPSAMVRLLESTSSVVRVVVASMRGSAPRDPGACLLITPDFTEGTIGGGHLEYEAIQQGRALLEADEGEPAVHIRQLILGRELGQCCGGAVQLWLERFTAADLPLLQAAAHAAQTSATAMLESDFDGIRVTRWLIDASSPESMRLLKSIAASHEHEHPARKRNVVRSIRGSVDENPGPVTAARDNPSIDSETGSFPSLQFTPNSTHTGILLERLSSPKQPLWVFGAGHVGQAIVRALSDLPFEITWIDSRASYLPTSLPANVRSVCESQPTEALAEAPPGAMYIVLTHDHAMDYSLCHAILQRGAFAWLGLIGSESKGARFRSRLRKDGIAPETIEKLVCPIGVEGIQSKSPAAIAIGVAAQLLRWTSMSVEAAAPAAHGPGQTMAAAHSPSDSRLPAHTAQSRTHSSPSASVTQIKVRTEIAAHSSSTTDCGESCDGCSSANGNSS